MTCSEKMMAAVLLTMFAFFVFVGILFYQVDGDDDAR